MTILSMRRFVDRSKQPFKNMIPHDSGKESETKVVEPPLNVFWFCKDNSIGPSVRKEKTK